MKGNFQIIIWSGILCFLIFNSCKDDDDDPVVNPDVCATSMPIGEDFQFNLPFYFPAPKIPSNNPMKVEAIELGRFLFWEKKLSGDNSMSCGTCHAPQNAFSDPAQFSVGIDGITGNRNSMALVNLVFQDFFFWDGRAPSLEKQALEPVPNPIEMHQKWDDAIVKIENDTLYPPLFENAFGSSCIDSVRVSKAIAQFVRTMVSSNSKYDKVQVGQATYTAMESLGLEIWQFEGGDPDSVPGGQFGADCFHCHLIAGAQFNDNQFHNNGLDSVFSDLGLGEVTGIPGDYGKFKTPTLRNIEYSGPYMHDGRFTSLEEVVDHYNTGGLPSATIDPFMKYVFGGLALTPQKKSALVAFLKTLSDPEFIINPDFQDPF